MNQELLKAMRARKLIEFTSNGHRRVLEPHIYGLSRGTEQLVGFQTRGTSASGGIPDWRRFDLADMSPFIVLEESFTGRRPNPLGTHSDWDEIYMVVQ